MARANARLKAYADVPPTRRDRREGIVGVAQPARGEVRAPAREVRAEVVRLALDGLEAGASAVIADTDSADSKAALGPDPRVAHPELV